MSLAKIGSVRYLTVIMGCIFSGMVLSACFTDEEPRERQNKILRLNVESERADLTVGRLVEEMHKASDPQNRFSSANCYIMRQKTISEQELVDRKISQEYISEVIFQQPDKLRWTFWQNKVPFKISICKNGRAWSLDVNTKKAAEIKGFALSLFNMSTAMLNPAKTPLDLFASVELACVYDGKTRLYRMICHPFDKRIAPYVLYVNTDTFLTVKAETIVYMDDGSEELYSSATMSYQWIDGVCLPNMQVVKAGNRTDICTTYEFKLNPKLDADEFDLPEWFEVPLEENGDSAKGQTQPEK